MSASRHDREYGQLQREIGTAPFQELLWLLQPKSDVLQRFRTWSEVLRFMHRGRSDAPEKEAVLRAVLEAHHVDRDPKWRELLLATYWPGLRSVHRHRLSWDPDPDELWQTIVWVFLRVVCQIDPARRQERLVQKIYNDTVHRLHDEYRRRHRQSVAELATGQAELVWLAGGGTGVDLVGVELRDAQRVGIKRLRRLVDRRLLSSEDFLLIVGSRLYGRPLVECAEALGLDYGVARKRRQRAEAHLPRRPWIE